MASNSDNAVPHTTVTGESITPGILNQLGGIKNFGQTFDGQHDTYRSGWYPHSGYFIITYMRCTSSLFRQVPFLDSTGGTAVVSEALTVGWARLCVCVGSPAWLETTGVK